MAEYILNVVNCATTIDEPHNYNVYMCPMRGGAYKDKMVRYMYYIKAVVVINKDYDGYIHRNNSLESDKCLISQAISRIKNFSYRIDELKTHPIQVFLLTDPVYLGLKKHTNGGMLSSKK